MAMKLTSPAFAEGAEIPIQYTGDGADRSPPLAWSDVPAATQSFALLCDDPDAPTAEPWVHWILYRIPAETRDLTAGIPQAARVALPAECLQGVNSWPDGQNLGYRGPAPPRGHGVHHYHFRLYALDSQLPEQTKLDKTRLLQLIDGHVLESAELVGTYQR